MLELLLEAGAEILDDGEDFSGWSSVLMPDMIRFSDTADISKECKWRVRALLKQAGRNMDYGIDEDKNFGRDSGFDNGMATVTTSYRQLSSCRWTSQDTGYSGQTLDFKSCKILYTIERGASDRCKPLRNQI